MIEPSFFFHQLIAHNTDFFTGVPDSLLKSFCAYITDTVADDNHIIAANEGCAVGLAAGYHLATKKCSLVYMQNSGIGNAVNPLLSLTDPDVYRIPLVLMIGWRGEPGIHDEPQHIKQGKVTLGLLAAMGIPHAIMATNEPDLTMQVADCFRYIAENNSPYVFVVRKDTFAPYRLKKGTIDKNDLMTREEAIEEIMLASGKLDIIISTTGMTSRELYELREKHGLSHNCDFLTVGSMGHASQIALSIALNRKDRTIICIDGDGACIMHMGGMMTIGAKKPANLKHIIINNSAHDSVGGQPTVAGEIDIPGIARAAGYGRIFSITTKAELKKALLCNEHITTFIEIRTRKGSRSDLGRPKESPGENKTALMNFISSP